MAYKNKLLSNKITGQDILFLQTAKDTQGAFLELESTYNANSAEPPLHYHPYQSEDFKVLSGALTIKHNGTQKILKEGETIHINANEPHAMWNSSGEKTVVHWKVQPAMNTEYLLETLNGLINDGKTKSNGMPGLLQISMIAGKFSSVFRLVKPAYTIQKIVFAILKPFAIASGKKAVYKKYID